jgi:hypothetical protein
MQNSDPRYKCVDKGHILYVPHSIHGTGKQNVLQLSSQQRVGEQISTPIAFKKNCKEYNNNDT